MEQLALQWGSRRNLLTVSELNARIRELLDAEFSDIWVSGEISGVRLASSGHYYFTLKDREAQIRCVCFRSCARLLKFKPQEGIAVLARGRIDVYDARGEYQLLVEILEPQGHGALQLAFEQLKKKLTAEGLFESGRKRALPKLPARIGIITSPSGAVIQDMLNILLRRFPGLHVRLYPAAVQGEGSVEAVCGGLRYFSQTGWAEVVILARGGGSIEDLWTFNEEAVARAIAGSSTPVISAVGHETDFTIADFVADLRAPTPSAAAELVTGTREQMIDLVNNLSHRLEQRVRYRLSLSARALHERGAGRAETIMHRAIGRRAQRIDELERSTTGRMRDTLRHGRRRWSEADAHLRRSDLRLRFQALRRRLDAAGNGLNAAMHLRLAATRRSLENASLRLDGMSPLKVLERGYAIVQKEDGSVLRSSSAAPPDSPLRIRLAKGKLNVRVEGSFE